MHWGWEHEPLVSARQHQLTRSMIDVGADAVVGGHPHVTQDTETYRGKPIIYSLGNFLFDGFSDAQNNAGWLLQMKGRQSDPVIQLVMLNQLESANRNHTEAAISRMKSSPESSKKARATFKKSQ